MTAQRQPVRKVLHVLGDKTWRPEYRFLGSTKDILGRRAYFAARGIECVELSVKGRHDHICLEMLQAMDLTGFDAVIMEHPRYPSAMAWLKQAHPNILQMIRGHNGELIHQLHTAYAYFSSGLAGWRWRLKRTRMTMKNVRDRFSFDRRCARLADYVLAISDWEAKRYWPRLTHRDKIIMAPYFLTDDYAVEAVPAEEKVHRCICTMSADWSPLAHDAAKVLAKLVDETPPAKLSSWTFLVTGDLGKHNNDYKKLGSSGRVVIAGKLESPFEVTIHSRVLAHLSNLGMGFKTKLLDFVATGGWVLMPRKLYERQPDELKPFCIVVEPLSSDGLVKALAKAEGLWPDATGVNAALRTRAFAGLDAAMGYAP